ncbi:hypothetical protein [Paenibacillus sp. M2]|uniref:hypothetical protein n=1 Tax=Paenibacillus sp. M2 TaxID=3341793 RepID=UPI003988E740
MLQISSGKFFNDSELHITKRTVVLYSNLRHHSIIETKVGRLEPAFTGANDQVQVYLFTYENRIPKGGVLVAVGDEEIVDQFIFYCSIKFKSIFTRDPDVIKKYCNNSPKDDSLSNSPLSLISHFFNTENNISVVSVEDFILSTEKLIGLPREIYSGVMACYRNIYHSLLHLNTNVDLAYSQLVYCLESLSQNFDGFVPTWDDYDQNIRLKLDVLLTSVGNEELSEEIRNILVKSANLKSQARFINFILQNTNDSFFQSEASESKYAIKKLDLKVALGNTYGQRSSFVHALKSMKKEAKMPTVTSGEVFLEDSNPFLTYRGLMRLTLHVLTNVVNAQPLLEKEEYNWHDELPGVVKMNLSPQYWLGKTTNFKPEHATKKLEGFVIAFTSMLQNKEKVLKFDLRPLLELYENLLPNSKEFDKLNMYALYVFYHELVAEDLKLPNYLATIDKYKDLLAKCSIEAMLLELFFEDLSGNWDANTRELTFKQYKKLSYKIKKISLPNSIEVTIILAIANEFLKENNEYKFKELINVALNQLSGSIKLQEKLSEYLHKDCEFISLDFILMPEDNDAELNIEYNI